MTEPKVEKTKERRAPGAYRVGGSVFPVANAPTFEPVDPSKHVILQRDHPRRLAQSKRQGFRIAKPEDLKPGYDGWQNETEGVIRSGAGDVIAMIGDRDRFIDRKRRQKEEQMSRDQRGSEEAEAPFYDVAGLNYRRTEGTRVYAVGIDLKSKDSES